MRMDEANGLFNDALNTFYFYGYITSNMVKDHLDREEMDCCHFTGYSFLLLLAARCSSVVRAFAHGAMGRRIDPSWGGHIKLFLVPASAPRLV